MTATKGTTTSSSAPRISTWMVSSDSHIVEPPDLWDGRLPADLADRGPQIVREDDDIGPRADTESAAVGELEQRRRFAGELVHAGFDRHQRAVADPRREEVDRQRRVAQLTDVGAGIGQTEHTALAGE